MKQMRITGLLLVPLLAGCYAGVGHILEEDYNPRFVMSGHEDLEEVQEEVPPPPANVQTYNVGLDGYALQGLASGTSKGTTSVVSLNENHYKGPFPLPADMKWYIEPPSGGLGQRVDVTCWYTPPTDRNDPCLALPPQPELGLMYVTSMVDAGGGQTYREQRNPQITSHYKIVGVGTLDDGSGIEITCDLVTIPTD